MIRWRLVLTAWFLVLLSMVANGTFRELVIEKWVSAAAAGVISGTPRHHLHPAHHQTIPAAARACIDRAMRGDRGSLARHETIAFEFLFGHYVDGASWQELLADYNLFAGRLWPIVLASIAAAPFVWTSHATSANTNTAA